MQKLLCNTAIQNTVLCNLRPSSMWRNSTDTGVIPFSIVKGVRTDILYFQMRPTKKLWSHFHDVLSTSMLLSSNHDRLLDELKKYSTQQPTMFFQIVKVIKDQGCLRHCPVFQQTVETR